MTRFSNIPAWQVALFGMLVMAAFLVPVEAFADAGFLTKICEKANDVWTFGKKSVYVLAGIGMLVMAVLAFFGRFKWSHLFALGGGVLLVATTAEAIEWLADGSGTVGC